MLQYYDTEIASCGIHAFHEMLGIDVDAIRLFWVLRSEEEKLWQAAYCITLSLTPDDTDLLWDTGKVESNQERGILCKPTGGYVSHGPAKMLM